MQTILTWIWYRTAVRIFSSIIIPGTCEGPSLILIVVPLDVLVNERVGDTW